MSRITLNVSGTTFEIEAQCLEKEPLERLPTLLLNTLKNNSKEIVVIDRPAEIFAAILAYYQTGDLHIPAGVCPGAFKKELEYWDIGADKLSECCVLRYFAFFSEQECLKKFCKTVLREKATDNDGVPQKPTTSLSSFRRFRRRVWDIIDNNESSLWAKIYFCGILLLVLLSIFILAFGTEPMFQRKLTKCELIEYYEHTENDNLARLTKYLGYPDCTQTDNTEYMDDGAEEEVTYYYYYYYDDDNDDVDEAGMNSSQNTHMTTEASTPSKTVSDTTGIAAPKRNRQKQKVHIPMFMIQNRTFDVLDKVTLALFTLDFLLRIFSCPSIPKYFMSIINIVDFVALLGTYIHVIVTNVEKQQRYLDNWLDITIYFQVLRTFRLFRVVKNIRAAKVLVYSVKQSLRDLLVLVLFLLIAICTFASIVYLAEDRTDFKSIPVGWWWALVTMTTVGYGDVYPKTGLGRLIGSLCAISGVILISLTLPVFVNNFLTLYNYAEVNETFQKTTTLKKKTGDEKVKATTDKTEEMHNVYLSM